MFVFISLKLMLGLFKKIGDFGKKIWNGVKSVAKKVVPVVKNILPAITPIVSTLIPGKGGMIMKGLNVGTNIADKIVNGSANARSQLERNDVQVDSPRIRFKN